MTEVDNGYGHLPDGNEEDGDVCRVCRVEGDIDDPLIYPCKCSGSVRFVHPMCLRDWLAHSKKRYCEICGHRYTFTKIYSDYIPAKIPAVVYVRQTVLWLYRMTCHVYRFFLAVLGWLIILPSLNLVTLRTLIWMADTSISYPTGLSTSPLSNTPYNVTVVANGAEVNETFPTRDPNVRTRDVFNSPVSSMVKLFEQNWRSMYRLESDSIPGFVFRGQILSVTVAAVLVGLLFFREWMNQQNLAELLPPDLPEDEPINPEEWIIMQGVARRTDEMERLRRRKVAVASYIAKRVNQGRVDVEAFRAEHRRKRELAQRARTVDELIEEIKQNSDAGRTETMPSSADHDPSPSPPPTNGPMIEWSASELDPLTRWPSPSVSDSTRAPSPLTTADQPEPSSSKFHDGPSSPLPRPNGSSPGFRNSLAGPSSSLAEPSTSSAETSNALAGPRSSSPSSPGPSLFGPSSPSESFSRPCELGEAGPSVTNVAYTAPEMLKEKGREQATRSGEPRLVFVDFGARDKNGKPYFPTKILPEARAAALSMARLNKWPVELKFDGQKVHKDDARAEMIIDVSNPDSRGDHGLETSDDVWSEYLDRAYEHRPLPESESGDEIRFDGEPETPTDEKSNGHVTVEEEDDSGDRSPHTSDDEVRPRRLSTPAPRVGVLRRGEDIEIELPEEVPPEPVQEPVDAAAPEMRAEVRPAIADPDGLDEEDILLEWEDWDGVLEVVGLIGPLSNLFQNIAFAITIMGVALTVLVGFPIVAGKVVLALDVIKSGFVLCRLLLRSVRVLTDPVLDVVFEITKEVILLPLWSSFQALERIVASRLHLQPSAYTSIGTFFARTEAVSWSSLLAITKSYLVNLYSLQRAVSLHLATSPALSDKIWCMLIGYGTVATAIAAVALAGELNIGRISTTLLEGIRHHALFLKLAIFMGVELILFPLVIGLIIDLCTIPLFEGATITSGLRYMRDSPFGAIFVSWLTGTMFMFTFASFLAHIRARTRKGALFFIRDPADASFSPVKDILERSTMSQFRKLAVSAIMYTVVVVIIFGVACWGLRYQTLYPILPLRTKNLTPLSSVPFDLLVLHLAVPPTLDFIRPYDRLAAAWNTYWKITCYAFCLSSLMHGKRHDVHCQQGGPQAMEWLWPILDPIFQRLLGTYDATGTHARVPASDRVALLPPSQRRQGGVFVPLTPNGAAKDDEAKLRLLKQDQRARTMKRDPKEDYTVVYLPQYWRTRIHVFIGAAMWVVALGLVVVGLGPIIVGRAIFSMFITEPVHDGYTYMAGGYVFCAAAAVGMSVRKTIMRTGVASRLRRSTMSTRVKRVVLPALTNVYALVMLFLVVPSLVGINYELHVGQIWKYGLDTEQIPVLHFWDAWALGCAICSLLVGMRSMLPPHMRRGKYRVAYDLAQLLHAPLWGSRPFHVLNKTILPSVALLLLPMMLPPLLLAAVMALPARLVGDQISTALLFRMAYPITTALLLAHTLRGIVRDRIVKVRQGIIDAEYEVEERVENYEPTDDKGVNGDVMVVDEDVVDIDGEEDEWEDAD